MPPACPGSFTLGAKTMPMLPLLSHVSRRRLRRRRETWGKGVASRVDVATNVSFPCASQGHLKPEVGQREAATPPPAPLPEGETPSSIIAARRCPPLSEGEGPPFSRVDTSFIRLARNGKTNPPSRCGRRLHQLLKNFGDLGDPLVVNLDCLGKPRLARPTRPASPSTAATARRPA